MNRLSIDYISDIQIQEKLKVYDMFEWHKEPSETYHTLKKHRALQLRDMYDHIILYHSGGSDSTTVLNSFLNNNIQIDEVVTTYFNVDAACLDGKKAQRDLKNFTGEYTQVKIDFSDILNLIKSEKMLEQTPNFSGQLHSLCRFNIDYLEKLNFTKTKSRKGKICHLYGESDPDVVIMDNKVYARASIKNKFISNSIEENTPFFTDIIFPKLHVKQCYLVAREIKNNLSATKNFVFKKNIVRDYFSHYVSPLKSNDNSNFVFSNLSLYSEPTILLRNMMRYDETFLDTYIQNVYKIQKPISEKIKIKNRQNYKYYELAI
jgi:hypothetical protein